MPAAGVMARKTQLASETLHEIWLVRYGHFWRIVALIRIRSC
jgi:hypothetical protein